MNDSDPFIQEYRDVDEATFRGEIVTQYRPAVLRGFVRHWPVVQRARESPAAFSRYLHGFDSGKAVDVLRTPPSAKGRIFYNANLDGFNYTHDRYSVSTVLERLAKYATLGNPPAIAVQSALIADCLPGFLAENTLPLLDPAIQPRIWIGNQVVTPPHFDESNNIACVVAGSRRFTLFPPEQIANLYIGPIGYAPTGTPISLVDLRAPDFERFPKFREALAHARQAVLEPGDAIYMPMLWWHHVESLAAHNALVNYWWKGTIDRPTQAGSAFDALLLSLITFKPLAPEHREAWRRIFEHYVFNASDDAAAHIPEHRRGVLGTLTPELEKQVREFLVKKLGG